MAEATRRRLAWLPSAVVTLSVALELVVAASGLNHAVVTVVLLVLAALAVFLSLWLSMGLRRESLALRAIIAVPLALSVLTTIVLVLEAEFRRRMVRP